MNNRFNIHYIIVKYLKEMLFVCISVFCLYGNSQTNKSDSLIAETYSNISAGYLDIAYTQCEALQELHPDTNSYFHKRAILLKAKVHEYYGRPALMAKEFMSISPNDNNEIIRYYWYNAFSRYCYLTNQPQLALSYLSQSIELSKSIYNNDRVKINSWITELFIIYYSEKVYVKINQGEDLPPRAATLFDNLAANENIMLPFEKALHKFYKICFTPSFHTKKFKSLINEAFQFGIEYDNPSLIIESKLITVRCFPDTIIKLDLLLQAEEYSKKIQTLRHFLSTKNALMMHYKGLGDYDEALKWGAKATYPRNLNFGTVHDTYSEISEIFELKGEIDSALVYAKIDNETYRSITKVQEDIMQEFFIKKLNNTIEEKAIEIKKNQWYIGILSIAFITIIFLTLRNIKINRTIKEKNKLLASSLQKTENFAHILSHDLRAPIHSIKNVSSYLFEDEKNLSEDGKESLRIIKECCENSILLITNIMTYIQSKENEVPLNNEEVKALFEQAETNLTEIIQLSNSTINYGHLPHTIYGNKVLLIQLFQNIIQNSIKYKIEDIPMVIDISYESNDQYGIISIADNGTGINEKDIEYFLKAFTQDEFESVSNGIGLGLSICNSIMKHHSGEILIERNVNSGTTVKLQFKVDLFTEM